MAAVCDGSVMHVTRIDDPLNKIQGFLVRIMVLGDENKALQNMIRTKKWRTN